MIITQKKHQVVVADLRRKLAKATGMGVVKQILSKAELIRLEAKAGADAKTVRKAAELRLLTERKLGKLLAVMSLRGGDRKSDQFGQSRKPSLKSLGVSRVQSSRWQRKATIPNHLFRQYLRLTADRGIEPSGKGLLRFTAITKTERSSYSKLAQALRSFARRRKTFACIFVRLPDDAYSPDRLRDLANLPVEQVAASKSHLHLWIVPEALEDGLRLLKAWGFRYASSLACAMTPTKGGDYWQQAHRFLLLGVRGKMTFQSNRINSAIADRSITTETLRRLIERVSPSPRLDLFETTTTPGWTRATHKKDARK